MVKTAKHKLTRSEVVVAYAVHKNQIVPCMQRAYDASQSPEDKTLLDIQVTILKCIENLMILAGIAA